MIIQTNGIQSGLEWVVVILACVAVVVHVNGIQTNGIQHVLEWVVIIAWVVIQTNGIQSVLGGVVDIHDDGSNACYAKFVVYRRHSKLKQTLRVASQHKNKTWMVSLVCDGVLYADLLYSRLLSISVSVVFLNSLLELSPILTL